MDTTQCADGANGLVAVVSWIDPFGVAHSWSAPAVSVTINNGASTPPQLSIPSWVKTYFSPNGDGQEDTNRVLLPWKNANVDVSAKVDATVVDALGRDGPHDRARDRHLGLSRWSDPQFPTAAATAGTIRLLGMGKSDSGSVVADGVYTVRLHAVDAQRADGGRVGAGGG